MCFSKPDGRNVVSIHSTLDQKMKSHHFFASPPNVSHGLFLMLLTVCPSCLIICQKPATWKYTAGAKEPPTLHADTFLDLVDDPLPTDWQGTQTLRLRVDDPLPTDWQGTHRLCLRVGSRGLGPPLVYPNGLLRRPSPLGRHALHSMVPMHTPCADLENGRAVRISSRCSEW